MLTHTYAGVNILRRKMRQLKVHERSFRVDTIASWALRLCLSYCGSSGWAINRPQDSQWQELYQACSALMDVRFIRKLLQASYSGVYVDEYQDCSITQHSVVLKLARDLPCRLLGDPLQGIFDFNERSIDWDRDVSATFEALGELKKPYRWILAGRPEIGAWLSAMRQSLECGEPLDLGQGVPRGVMFRRAEGPNNLFLTQSGVCGRFQCDGQESVIAIHKGAQPYKHQCHSLARSLGGKFSSIEEIEGKELFSFMQKLERAPIGSARLKTVIEFACQCMTHVKENLTDATSRGEKATVRHNTRNPSVAAAANDYLTFPSSANMAALLTNLKTTNKVKIIRADLFTRMIGILRKHVLNPSLAIDEAANRYHTEFRHRGRPPGRRKLIGTTLLVKGLEFDHAIVLDAESLSAKELYVALTRGSKSVTIISNSPVLHPAG